MPNISKEKFRRFIERFVKPRYLLKKDPTAEESAINDLTSFLWSTVEFRDWAYDIHYPKCVRLMNFDAETALFMNFNYTKTLEDVYGIPASDILHIHGVVAEDKKADVDEIIVGHGMSKTEVEKNFGSDGDDLTKGLKTLVNHL